MIKERIHKNTIFKVKRTPDEDESGCYIIEAFIGQYFDLGVTITFGCLPIEWEKDFDFVVVRCKQMLKEFTIEDNL